MKISRLVTVGVTVALAASSSLLVAGAANAGETSAPDSYITASQFGVEGASYPAGWFKGGGSTGTIETTPTGLSITSRMQILNGTPGTTSTPDLVALADGANIGVVSGEAFFQIPLFTNSMNKTGFTTLRPDNSNNPAPESEPGWTTSQAYGTFGANTSHTMAEYQAQVKDFPNFMILAYGAFVPADGSAVLSSITFNGMTTRFTSKSTGTATPASVTVSEFAATGVAVHLTGFVPGETVDGAFASTNSGEATGESYIADADGNVDFTFKRIGTAPGTYTVSGNAADSGVSAFSTVTVVADGTAVTVAPPATPVAAKAHFTG